MKVLSPFNPENRLESRVLSEGFVHIHPNCQALLHRLGLRRAADFLQLQGLVIGGHPNRHVVQLRLGDERVLVYLKREQQVRWRDRWANARAGFGWVSRSVREAQILGELRRAGIDCPEVMACGEDDRGQAFVLVRALESAVELRRFLRDCLEAPPGQRRHWAERLGETLAHVHESGFDHPDLYSKHILIDPSEDRFPILDWQRSRRRSHIGWGRRWRNLAALNATLADDLVSPRERLWFLRAYLRASLVFRAPAAFRRQAVRSILGESKRLLRRRRIRENRLPALPINQHGLIWLDGEALCVTPAFHASFQGSPPRWLTQTVCNQAPTVQNPLRRGWFRWPWLPDRVTCTTIDNVGSAAVLLCRRQASRPLGFLLAWLRGRRLSSPEKIRVGLLFRLQRLGIATPGLLALGQRRLPPCEIQSFLLTETPRDTVSLVPWLEEQAGRTLWTSEIKQRRSVLRQVGTILRRMHEGNCYLLAAEQGRGRQAQPIPLRVRAGVQPAVVLGDINAIGTRRRPSDRRARRDRDYLARVLRQVGVSRTDLLRFQRAYERLDHD